MRFLKLAALALAIVGGAIGVTSQTVSATPLSASAQSGLTQDNPLVQTVQYRRRYYRGYRGYRPVRRYYRPYRAYRPVYRPARRYYRPYRAYRPVYRPVRRYYRPYRAYRPVYRPYRRGGFGVRFY